MQDTELAILLELAGYAMDEVALGKFDAAKAAKILEKCADFGDASKVTIESLISYFCEDTYAGKFEGLSTDDIVALGKMIFGTAGLAKRFYGADTEEESKEFDKQQIIPLGAVGNGDHYLFSLKSKKVMYYSHDGEPALSENSPAKFEDWRDKCCK